MKGDLPMYVRKIITAKMARKYRNATKKEKSVILNSLEELTGFNRSYLMRRLRTYTSGNSKSGTHRGRKNKYTKEDEGGCGSIAGYMGANGLSLREKAQGYDGGGDKKPGEEWPLEIQRGG